MKKVVALRDLRRWKRYGPWRAGEIVELEDEDAAQAIELGLAAEVGKNGEKNGEKAEGEKSVRHPLVSLPVKTGGKGWIDVSLWEPDVDAEEEWKRRARISVRRLVKTDGGVEVKETLHLSPSEAVLLGGVLQVMGVRGKEMEKDSEKDENR